MGFKLIRAVNRKIYNKLEKQILDFAKFKGLEKNFRKASEEFAKHFEAMKWEYLGIKEKRKRL